MLYYTESEAWDALNQEQRASIERLMVHVKDLGPNALQIFEAIGKRLSDGATYGDFDQPKDWVEETLQECYDGLAYLTRRLHLLKSAEANH